MAEEEKKNEKQEKEIGRIKLDFKALEKWRNPQADDLPIYSFISFYQASGVAEIFEKYRNKTQKNLQFAPVDNVRCNFYTLQRIRGFIMDNWTHYSMELKGDNRVVWNTHKYAKGERHRKEKLWAKTKFSLNADFINYCPSIDDDLDDNTLVLCVYEDEEESVVC